MEAIAKETLSRRKGSMGLRLIAVIKLGKAVLLTGLALGVFGLINRDFGELAQKVAYNLRIDPENHVLRMIVAWIANVDPATLRTFGLGALIYAGVLYTEGVSLWLNQAWAKYFVLVSTGIFVPQETYYCVLFFRWWRILILGVNLAVLAFVAYVLLINRNRHEQTA